MGVVIGVDAGTTGVRALAVDESGRPVAMAYRELSQHLPRPGWVEHDAGEIWRAVQATLAAVATELDGLGRAVAAIGITNQRETVVAWDRRSGFALAPAIVWSDRRTALRCAELEEAGHLGLVRARTGLVLDPYFSGTKAEWLLGPGGVQAGPDLALGTVDTWVLWNLSGGKVFATDASNASRTMLFDITELAWSDELCDLFGVPVGALAEVRPSAGRFGVSAAGAAGPLPSGVPISGVAGDQAAALFGQACFVPGMAKCTYGTGAFVLANVGRHPPTPADGLLTSVAWDLSGNPGVPAGERLTYAMEGSVFCAGSAIGWLRDGLKLISAAGEISALARSVPDSGGLVMVPAFTGLGAPWWDPLARGALVGVTGGAGKAQLARAVLEAISHQVRDVTGAMSDALAEPLGCLRVDGGVSAAGELLQIQADQLGIPVTRPICIETTALGAAQLAGLAEGMWGSLEELASCWAPDLEFAPRISRAAAEARHGAWRAAVARSLAWAPTCGDITSAM